MCPPASPNVCPPPPNTPPPPTCRSIMPTLPGDPPGSRPPQSLTTWQHSAHLTPKVGSRHCGHVCCVAHGMLGNKGPSGPFLPPAKLRYHEGKSRPVLATGFLGVIILICCLLVTLLLALAYSCPHDVPILKTCLHANVPQPVTKAPDTLLLNL